VKRHRRCSGCRFYDLTGNYAVSYANAALAGVVNLAIVGTLYWMIRRQRGGRPALA
jgi:hypothetical protein